MTDEIQEPQESGGVVISSVEEMLKHELIPDGTVPSGYRFAALSDPNKPGIPATYIEAYMVGEIFRLRKVNKRLMDALLDLLDSPYTIDEASVPRAWRGNRGRPEDAPDQVVGTLSIALKRYARTMRLIGRRLGIA